MYSFQIGKSTRFYEIGLLPNVFKEMFLMANQVHSYITRNSNTFCIISCPNKYKTFGIRLHGPKCFNLQSAATRSLFKSTCTCTLKAFLLS